MESEFIQWLRDRVPSHPQVPVGIGSDAALLRLPSGQAVVTTDALMDGVDFRLTEIAPRRAGRKALAVNLSDLAAMGARPVAAFVSLVLPRSSALPLAQQLYEGLLGLAEEFGVALAGGDTNTWDGPLVVNVTAVGEPGPGGVWTRGGARPGDAILVTGSFGGSIRGKHLDFVPRVAEALALAGNYSVHAATDVSDGLSLDLHHILSESQRGALLELEAIPLADDARILASEAEPHHSPLEHALADGEDFELILIVPPCEAERLLAAPPFATPLTRIGTITDQPGMVGRRHDGSLSSLTPRGYQH